MADLLTIRDLRVYLDVDAGTVKAVDGVSFRVPEGGTVALVGESGSGKSVIAQSDHGHPAAHRAHRGGRDPVPRSEAPGTAVDIAKLDRRRPRRCRTIRGGRISMIFQEPMTSLSPLHTIGNQIGEALAAAPRGGQARAARARDRDAAAGRLPRPGEGRSTPIRSSCRAGCASAR